MAHIGAAGGHLRGQILGWVGAVLSGTWRPHSVGTSSAAGCLKRQKAGCWHRNRRRQDHRTGSSTTPRPPDALSLKRTPVEPSTMASQC